MPAMIRIPRREKYDRSALDAMFKGIGKPDVWGDDLESEKAVNDVHAVKSIRRRLGGSRQDELAVEYMQSPALRTVGLGRLYPSGKGYSLANCSRRLRNTLAGSVYWDVDIKAAHPTMMLCMCKVAGWPCEALQDYVEFREEWLKRLAEHYGCERKEAKRRVNALAFGQSLRDEEGPHPEAMVRLATEFKEVGCRVVASYPEFAKVVKREAGADWWGQVLAHFMQDFERQVLMEVVDGLDRRGRVMDVLLHDGGMVRRKLGETEMPEEILREVEAEIAERFPGLSIELVVKPMDDEVYPASAAKDKSAADSDAVYEAWKAMVEREWFFVMQPPMYVREYQDGRSPYTSSPNKFKETWAHAPENAHLTWMSDPSKRMYERMDFLPPGCVLPSDADKVRNTWPGFAVERYDAKGGSAQPFLDHMRMLFNGDEASVAYHLKYFAQMFREPGELNGIALVLYGDPGCGKTWVVKLLQRMMGPENGLWSVTSKPETELFARFGTVALNKILCNIDEPSPAVIKSHAEAMKNKITDDKVTVELKGVDSFTVRNCCRYVFTTNKKNCVPVDDGDRRYAIGECSGEKIHDHEYWTRLWAYIDDKANLRAVYDYLVTEVEYSGTNWKAERPRSAMSDHMRRMNSDVFHDYFVVLRERLLSHDPLDDPLDFDAERGYVDFAGCGEFFKDFKDYARKYHPVCEDARAITTANKWYSTLDRMKVVVDGNKTLEEMLEMEGMFVCRPWGDKKKKYRVWVRALTKYLVAKGLVTALEAEEYAFEG